MSGATGSTIPDEVKKHLRVKHVGPWVLFNIQQQTTEWLEAHGGRDLNDILKDCLTTIQGTV